MIFSIRNLCVTCCAVFKCLIASKGNILQKPSCVRVIRKKIEKKKHFSLEMCKIISENFGRDQLLLFSLFSLIYMPG